MPSRRRGCGTEACRSRLRQHARPKRDAKDRISTEPRLVRRAVELDQRLVDALLVTRVETLQTIRDLAFDVGHGPGHALAAVALRITVPQLHRLVDAGGGARRHYGPAAAL